MLRSLTAFIKTWRNAHSAGHQLDVLLAMADAGASYTERSEWLIELAHWIRRPGRLQAESGDEGAAAARPFAEHTRLRYLLNVLDRNPGWRANVAGILRAILRESDGMSLLCDAGMPVHSGFVGALVERVQTLMIPPAPNRRELSALFTLMFTSTHDAEWIDALPIELLDRIRALFQHDEADDARRTGAFSLDLLAALHNLTCQISSTGMSQLVRSRLGDADARVATESQPFYRLPRAMLAVEAAYQLVEEGAEPAQLLREVNYLRLVLDQCRIATDDVFANLYRNGVSVDIVFQVERMRMRITRTEHLLDAWMASDDMRAVSRLAAELVKANRESRSISHLLNSNVSLLTRKVVEYNADTGEHYIARDRQEYLKMLRMAAGGGLVTVMTVCVKFSITGAHLPSMLEGLLAGINYAASFLLIHFLHFSLATKQPAMTAPTLARELDGAGTPQGMDEFVASVFALIRTQAAAVLGNVMVVFPVCLGLQLLMRRVLDADIISPAKAQATLESFSLLGPTPIYAALTGVLLWSSSLLAGWVDNWFMLHRVGDALEHNRRLRLTLGAARAARLAAFWRSNIAGVAGNISLGLMLGLVPALLSSFAFSFDVRHVTLSAGSIGVALGVLGTDTLRTAALWWAVAGVCSMAVLNVAVSFALAFHMAIRSRDLRRAHVRSLYEGVWRRVRSRPMDLVWPGLGQQRAG
ncbi:site-specific recombinase [Variovorax ureilyticus]|uniref:site-specific recombinase n=1 Tax=Variovorax ureilyticus TaxID=1836198 RepID=UPI003D67F791